MCLSVGYPCHDLLAFQAGGWVELAFVSCSSSHHKGSSWRAWQLFDALQIHFVHVPSIRRATRTNATCMEEAPNAPSRVRLHAHVHASLGLCFLADDGHLVRHGSRQVRIFSRGGRASSTIRFAVRAHVFDAACVACSRVSCRVRLLRCAMGRPWW